MKSRITRFPFICVAVVFCLTIIAGCAKEGDDLTLSVVGNYVRGSGPNALIVTITKVKNDVVAVNFETTKTASTHGNCTMNSTTDLTLNLATERNLLKDERYEYTGTGTLNGTDLVIARHEKVFSNSTGTLITEYDTTYVVRKR
jgi:hypothetical protein